MPGAVRFAFTISSNAIGWSVIALNDRLAPVDVIDAGVRVFSDGRDPKTGEPLAAGRRLVHSASRRRDRYVQRRTHVLSLLVNSGLMPDDALARKALEELDPYLLRLRGLDEPLTLHEFGRALFHLNQRRGFQHSRAADVDDEGGKMKSAIKQLEMILQAGPYRTYGEFLAGRQASADVRQRKHVRVRHQGDGPSWYYEFFPAREMIRTEFDLLWTTQARFHPELTSQMRHEIEKAIFFQRPHRTQGPSRCEVFSDEFCLSRGHPLVQARRIYEQLNDLTVQVGSDEPRPLRREERDNLVSHLLSGKDLTFKQILRMLKLPKPAFLILPHKPDVDTIYGDQSAKAVAGKNRPLADIWHSLDDEDRAHLVTLLGSSLDEEEVISTLRDMLDIGEDAARATIGIKLPAGYDRLGPTANRSLLARLAREVVPSATAWKEAVGIDLSAHALVQARDRLPYYGEILWQSTTGGTLNPADDPEKCFGRLNNPTCHIALNQLRKIVNSLVDLHGRPAEIVFETARELDMSRDQRQQRQRELRARAEKNKTYDSTLQAGGWKVSFSNRLRLHLWEELGKEGERRCIYSGRLINMEDLFSTAVEITYILPFASTLDDSASNKTLAFADARRGRRALQTFDAYDEATCERIVERAEVLPDYKKWRFRRNALSNYVSRNGEAMHGQLHSDRRIRKLTQSYLQAICARPDRVWAVKGQLTAPLRHAFGLHVLKFGDAKAEFDWRDRAIDACVVGLTDPVLLGKLCAEGRRNEGSDVLGDVFAQIEAPFPNLVDRIASETRSIVVTHRPDHGSTSADSRLTSGALHKETNFGINNGTDIELGELVLRRPLMDLSPKEVDKVRDPFLRRELQKIRTGVGGDAKAFAAALRVFGEDNNLRRIRILKKQEDYIAISNRQTGEPYRAVISGENQYMDIIEDSDGSWKGVAVSVFAFNQKRRTPAWMEAFPEAKPVMRVHKNDLLQLTDESGKAHIMRVVRIAPSSNTLYLAAHFESGDLGKRHDDPGDPFRWDYANIGKLAKRHCRFYRADILGKPRSGRKALFLERQYVE